MKNTPIDQIKPYERNAKLHPEKQIQQIANSIKAFGFNHTEFWEYARKLSQTHRVYISEYTAPEDFKEILSFPQNSTLQGGSNKGQPNECLFQYR